MNTSALFFDIDGTLTDNRTGKIWKSGMDAVSRAMENGHLCFVNTGRTLCSIQDEVKNAPFDGLLCGLGTYIQYHGKEIFHQTISQERQDELVRLLRECQIDAVLEGTSELGFTTDHSRFADMQRMYQIYTGRGLVRSGDGADFDKFFAVTDEQSDTERFFREIGDMEIIDRERKRYEIVPKGFSKAEAIRLIQEHFGIDLDHVFVFGDSANDMSMFEYAVHTVAMGSHSEVLEPHTEFITKDVTEDGLAFAMKKYGFL